jgi:tetratricopeptide (TPR) repeat protein
MAEIAIATLALSLAMNVSPNLSASWCTTDELETLETAAAQRSSPEFASTTMLLSQCEIDRNEYTAARTRLEDLHDELVSRGGTNRLLPQVATLIAVLHEYLGDHEAAQSWWSRLQRDLDWGEERVRYERYLALGEFLADHGSPDEAQRLLEKALAIVDAAAPSSARALDVLAILSDLKIRRGDFQGALDLIDRELRLQEEVEGDQASLAPTYFRYADALEGLGKDEDARRYRQLGEQAASSISELER